MTILLYLLSNSLALYLAQRFVAGFVFQGALKEYIIAGILLGILQVLVRPILKLITFPLIILTLGLFNVIISAILIFLVASITGFIVIQGLQALFWATLVFAIVNSITHWLAKIF